MHAALSAKPDEAAETLGHIDYHYYIDRYSEFLAEKGDTKAAADAQDKLHHALSARNVLQSVLEEVAQLRDSYQRGARSVQAVKKGMTLRKRKKA